ncbi:MAG: isocitrate dehydrogenase [Candidatus Aquicultor secundus]|uniref:isocitrate/isopropylmalate dehydrogenase family protein n=1 Tax=Candidatus Aquicultor secundus TaxID=1973895 RepID=UPI0009140D4F|nr:isocitrate/isopropylmalate dehydrogenase family protein [Candidatus Aquicultor secundus]NCO65932.1 isocitrate/isopropylmalate dehydrogenase family protein [Solirubrobacter sp.]OIO86061.1 MAG: isocitrate dehydrogenase [Candidatus Aquicultor secundus]PIU26769.1 MAG: isocitrate dehydrogenase [Candidatus Aquicultor secundus]PIW22906.1 MAG: isocitrate dehydrogenase [Candidatus Aquicultor secundus]PIX52739.1 MAG: isocitrate dehydrogenase [Candidatus Aquicultor secundus]
MHTITLIPGDGIGPEISEAMRRVVESTGVKIDWDVQEAGADAMEKYGTPLPEQVLDSIRKNKIAIKGPVTTPIGSGFRSVNVALRKELDLYVNLRPCYSLKGVKSRYEDIDLVIVRENTEDLYAGIEFEEGSKEAKELIDFLKARGAKIRFEDAGISIKPISITGSERIVRFAYEYARREGRKKVTAVHKANIMKHSDGLFLRVANEVGAKYPDIETEDRIVDNMCMQLVQKPELYDVLVCPNLYGDILSDLCSGLIGGLGMAPSANIGEEHAVFESVHGSAPKYAGQNKVNPSALILSSVLMLHHIGEREAADKVFTATRDVVAEGKHVTYDLGGTAGTSQMADAILNKILS